MNPDQQPASSPVEYKEVDIFAWTNNLVQYVDELKIDLYFFNKNFTPYKVKLSGETSRQLRALFIDEILEYVLDGIEKGLIVRTFEEAEKEANVLQKTLVKNVDKLVYTQKWIQTDLHNVETFSDNEHDIKRMKGVMAHCYHVELDQDFYVIKSIPSSQVMKGVTAWTLKDDTFRPFDDMSAIKIPSDNQLLAVGDDLFVFNQPKLKQLFGYDAKAAAIALQKVAEIEKTFRLSFADGATLQTLVIGRPATIRKLQKLEVEGLNQAEFMRHAEDMGVDLMVDDSGAIIIMDSKDLTRFVNLINDDYMESPVTGQRYEVLSKRVLRVTEEPTGL